jgi:hypothetical protein
MSLDFGPPNGNRRVNCGNDTSLQDLTTFSCYAWVYNPNNNITGGRILSKGDDIKDVLIRLDTCRLFVGRATSPDHVGFTFGAADESVWRFVAFTYSESDVQGYKGSLTSTVAVQSLSVFNTGSGATTDDNTNELWLGNRSTGTTNRTIGGSIAVVGYIAKVLSIGELRRLQFHPTLVLAETRGLWVLGHNGLGTQPDWSGNGNNGTIGGTGTDVSDHVPLRPLWVPDVYQRNEVALPSAPVA